jgi:hypothetical protein
VLGEPADHSLKDCAAKDCLPQHTATCGDLRRNVTSTSGYQLPIEFAARRLDSNQ